MNRDQKAAVVEEVAGQIRESQAVFAVDYRGISVPQAVDLRVRLSEADATFRVVKNTLSQRAADQAGAEGLRDLLEGPTAFTFVRGDAALAAKAIADFQRITQLLDWKGGTMDGSVVTADDLRAIARLPSREVLQGQFVGVLASPITGLVRGLAALISGLASQLKQIEEQGLVTGASPAPAAVAPDPAEPAAEEPDAEEPAPEASTAEAGTAEEPAPAGGDQTGTEPPPEGDQ